MNTERWRIRKEDMAEESGEPLARDPVRFAAVLLYARGHASAAAYAQERRADAIEDANVAEVEYWAKVCWQWFRLLLAASRTDGAGCGAVRGVHRLRDRHAAAGEPVCRLLSEDEPQLSDGSRPERDREADDQQQPGHLGQFDLAASQGLVVPRAMQRTTGTCASAHRTTSASIV